MKSRCSLHERALHGTTNFPFAVYHGRIPEWLGGFPPHWHEEFEIIYVSYGCGVISVDGRRFQCREGDIVLIPPSKIHAILRHEDDFMAYYNILFDFALLEENPSSLCSQRFFSRFEEYCQLSSYYLKKESPLNGRLLLLVKELAALWEKDFAENALLIKARLFEIMHLIRNEVTVSGEGNSSKAKVVRLKKIFSFVKENFAEHISVEQVAELVHLSPSRLMAFFHEETGMSFVRYVNDYRLEVSAEELLDSKKTVSEIAEDCGFGNVSYFIQIFKRKFSVSPSEYRRKDIS